MQNSLFFRRMKCSILPNEAVGKREILGDVSGMRKTLTFAALAFGIASSASYAKPPICTDPEACSVMPESPVKIGGRPHCTDTYSCIALINLSSEAQVSALYIAEQQHHGQVDWSGNLFVGDYQLHPFKWTAWSKPPKFSCHVAVKIQLRYRGQTIDVDPETFNLCKRDAAGHAMIKEICVHYPPEEFPASGGDCRMREGSAAE